jgi:hypothetical protein
MYNTVKFGSHTSEETNPNEGENQRKCKIKKIYIHEATEIICTKLTPCYTKNVILLTTSTCPLK